MYTRKNMYDTFVFVINRILEVVQLKKNMFKFVLSIIAIALITTSLLIPSAEAATPTVFWASPTKAKKLGTTFSTEATITYKDLKNINKYYDNKERNESISAGIATSILTAPLALYASIPAGNAVGIIMSYRNSYGALVNKTLLNNNTNAKFKVKLTYQYYRKGSRDGMYNLTKIQITKK